MGRAMISAMSFITPQYSKKAVSRAGDIFISDASDLIALHEAIEIISNWRSSHSYPLQVIKNTLSRRAKKIDKKAIIAQRLKRLSSIHSKLRRLDKTRLSGMQDIGGCRAILNSAEQVQDLVGLYEDAGGTNPLDRPRWIDEDDYILSPKPSGYRGIHLIFAYHSSAPNCAVFNGHKIEIQLRSLLQHYWATAVETASSFLGEALKSDEGDPRWLRFFALASSYFAIVENCELVPNTPDNAADLLAELKGLWDDLQVEIFLRGCRVVTDKAKDYKGRHTFLLRLDSEKKLVNIYGYTRKELLRATEDYLAMEKEYASQPEIQVVLVAVDSLAKLKSAYPNYYADTGEFITVLKAALNEPAGV